MKRSQINALIRDSKAFFDRMHFRLPPWATWRPAQWKGKGEAAREIVEAMLGWDLTDFGSGDFARRGLILIVCLFVGMVLLRLVKVVMEVI